MKKISLLILASFITSVSLMSYAKASFKDDELEHFEITNHCSGCDLSSAALTSNHSGAILDNANLSNVYTTQNHLNLSQAHLQNANLTGAWLPGANFSQADLTGAVFAGAFLRGANFYGAMGVNLKNAAEACDIVAPNGVYIACKS